MPSYAFMHNAVMHEELAHQQRELNKPRSRWQRLILRALFWFALTICMILFWGEIVAAITARDPRPIAQRLNWLVLPTVVYVVVLHFLTLFRTLAFASNAIVREKQSGNWESLILTGVDARQIVLGKWWATVLALWRSYARLALLRAPLVAWFGSALSLAVIGVFASIDGGRPIPIPPYLGNLFLTAVLVVAFTLASALFTAAVGVAASAQYHRPATALALAIAGRTLFLLASAALVYLLGVILFPSYRTPFALVNFFYGLTFTLLDNGVFGPSTFSGYTSPTTSRTDGAMLLALLFSLLFYLSATAWLLRLAERRAIRQGALPPAPAVKAVPSETGPN